MIFIPDSVYPKDATGHQICPRCKKIIAQCSCPSIEAPKPKTIRISPHIRLEKSGRKGKAVTMIEGLPRNEDYLKQLAKTLKTKTGSGGTSYFGDKGGVIEIQGDHQEVVRQILKDQ